MSEQYLRTSVNRHVLEHAEGFYKLACLIYDDSELRGIYGYQAIANYSFACEVALKSIKEVIISVESGQENSKDKIHGHSLTRLFNKLEESNRELLLSTFSEKSNCSLDESLKECSSYFQDARYGYEEAKCFQYSEVKILAKGLIASIREIWGKA